MTGNTSQPVWKLCLDSCHSHNSVQTANEPQPCHATRLKPVVNSFSKKCVTKSNHLQVLPLTGSENQTLWGAFHLPSKRYKNLAKKGFRVLFNRFGLVRGWCKTNNVIYVLQAFHHFFYKLLLHKNPVKHPWTLVFTHQCLRLNQALHRM